jgi:micrococcal nuclease
MYTYNAEVVHVVDGDTVDVVIDLGFNIKFKERVRLLGINAPERFTDEGKLATQFVSEWLAESNNQVVLATYKNEYDKYGRYLASVMRNGNNLSTDLLEKGLADVY